MKQIIQDLSSGATTLAELPAPGGGALPIDGTLRGIGGDALILRQPGDCHVGTLNAEPVDCRLTHTGEFIGYLDDPTDLGPEYPGGTELFDAALPACELLVDEYAVVREHSGARVRAQTSHTDSATTSHPTTIAHSVLASQVIRQIP